MSNALRITLVWVAIVVLSIGGAAASLAVGKSWPSWLAGWIAGGLWVRHGSPNLQGRLNRIKDITDDLAESVKAWRGTPEENDG